MKTPSLQSVLAGIGAGSLLIYVLACATSFSPDDRQILYPSFDPQSGAPAVAVYDRHTGKSELIYTATVPEAKTNREPVLMRAGWMPDGKHVLVGAVTCKDELDFLVIPRNGKEPIRHFLVGQGKAAEAMLEFPFAIIGNQLFINAEKRNPMRLNLVTGEVLDGGESTNSLMVLPAPDGKTLVAMTDTGCGTFDPQTMTFKPYDFAITNSADGCIVTFDAERERLFAIVKEEGKLQLRILKGKNTEFSRPLSRGTDKLQFGPFLDLAPSGKTICTAYCAEMEGATNVECGLAEIPLNDQPVRFTPLFHLGKGGSSELLMAQPSLSHDGRAWAIGTACLYLQNESLKADDCALFVVDLTKAKRPVTKVAIPVPAERKRLIH